MATVTIHPERTAGDTHLARVIYDASGNTVLVGADGESRQLGEYGFFYARPSTYTEIATGVGVFTKINFNAVIEDTHGIYNTTDNTIDIPVDCKYFDAEYAVELANVASGFGSSAGTVRGFVLNDISGSVITGLSSLPCTKVGMDGGTYGRHGMRIPNNPTSAGLSQYRINPRFTQDSGVTIRVGDSSGTGVAQTYIKIRLYK
jgi:hypothetical protein